jgi:hypothetical protein
MYGKAFAHDKQLKKINKNNNQKMLPPFLNATNKETGFPTI